MANEQTKGHASGGDKKEMMELFHSIADKGKPLTEIPWENLNKTETARFLIERIKKHKGESAKVVENIGNLSRHLQDQKGRVLTAAISEGYPAEKVPLTEYITGTEGEERKALLDAVVKQGKGKWFINSLSNLSFTANVLAADVEASYKHVADRLNSGLRAAIHKKLFGLPVLPYEAIASRAKHDKAKTDYLTNLTEQLKTKGVEAMELFREYPSGAFGAFGYTRTHPNGSRAKEHAELRKVLENILETEFKKGLEGTLKTVYAATELYYHDEYIRAMFRGAVKQYPALLKAIDKALPKRFNEIDQMTYLDLANAAVTGTGFKWEDLNLQRLSDKFYVGTDGLFDKNLDFKEQMTLIVTSAKEAGVKVPEEFEKFANSGLREKIVKKMKGLQRTPYTYLPTMPGFLPKTSSHTK
jgi:hypothetical protein